jgi:hypothetical protein
VEPLNSPRTAHAHVASFAETPTGLEVVLKVDTGQHWFEFEVVEDEHGARLEARKIDDEGVSDTLYTELVVPRGRRTKRKAR